MEYFKYKNILVALRIRTFTNGSIPLTQPQEPLQLVTLKHPKGKYLKAHLHTPKKRTTAVLQECLIVRKGKVKIDLYTMEQTFIKHIFLHEGDVFILVCGGYGITVLKDCELIEVKNGPFIEDKVLIT
jgi:hypothetical protein